jgi:hypothetical protein
MDQTILAVAMDLLQPPHDDAIIKVEVYVSIVLVCRL